MLFLSVDVAGHGVDLFFTQRQGAISVLPTNLEFGLEFSVRPKGRRPLYLPDEFADRQSRRQAYE
jgi:hypothetical protein